jgi:hypothetical protein
MANKDDKVPWRAAYENDVAIIDALSANENVMNEICLRTPNDGGEDNAEQYQQNIDATLKGWAETYSESAWGL